MKKRFLKLGVAVACFSAASASAKEHDFSGAYNHPVIPDPVAVEVIAPVFAQISGHASGDIYIPSNYKLIFGDVTSTDVAIQKTSANTITVNGNLTCTGTPCGTAGFSSPMTTLGDLIAEDATPTPVRLPGPTTPNGVPQILTDTPSGGAAALEAWALPGVPTNAQTGTTYTIAVTDRASYVTFSNGSAIAVTLPSAASAGFGSNFVFVACDIGAGTATITPTTSTISYTTGSGYTSAASSLALTTGQCAWIYSDNTNYFAIQRTGGAPVYPVTVSGTVTSGGIPYFNSTTQSSSSAALTANVLVKGGGAGGAPANSLTTDDGTTSTYTGTGGTKSPAFTATGTTAGFADFPQGSTSAAVAPCNTATSICEQAPTAVTSYLVTKPGVSATGIYTNNVSAAVITQGISGDANHSATVTIGSGTSIGSTTLCSSTNCPAGTYVVHVYVDITTACGTTGTYIVNLIYTDDQGAKTAVVNLNGTGSVPATGTLTTTSTANYGENAQVLRLTSGNLNYSTTATACGSAGPMVGKLYMAATPVM